MPMRVRSRKTDNKMATNVSFNVGEANASTEVNSPYSTETVQQGYLFLGAQLTTKSYRTMLLFN